MAFRGPVSVLSRTTLATYEFETISLFQTNLSSLSAISREILYANPLQEPP